MHLNPIGLLLIAGSLIFPLLLSIPLAQEHPLAAIISQYIGIAALIVMAWIQLIATRLRPIESLMGPMDQVYRLHKWLGIAALALVALHDNLDAEIDALINNAARQDFAESLGSLSYNGLLVLVIASVLMLIPYRIWYFAHRFIGVLYVLSFLHFFIIAKPYGNLEPLGLYTNIVCIIGILSYLWKLTPRAARMRGGYVVDKVENTGLARNITLTKTGRGFHHRPGQFAYFSFDVAGRKETHPFTIASAAREDRSLDITAAPLGDYTRASLPKFEVGTPVHVEGAFGRFFRKKGTAPEIWIAGGIGITPFLAWSEAMKAGDRKAVLIYCVPDKARAAHLEALSARAGALDNLDVVIWESSTQGRLTTQSVLDLYPTDISQAHVHFCGPAAMRDSLRAGLKGAGLKARRFRAEAFEMRTGVGIERLLGVLWRRAMALIR